jgi:CheY-like chemotaxis protein
VPGSVASHSAVGAVAKRILVVDDEPGLRRLLGDLFASEGYLVSEASNGAGGLDYLRAFCPDVIILDLMMPGMSGWTFLAEIRRISGCPDIPIIAMSAMYDIHRAASGLRALGVRECLAKPFDVEALLSLVGTLV